MNPRLKDSSIEWHLDARGIGWVLLDFTRGQELHSS